MEHLTLDLNVVSHLSAFIPSTVVFQMAYDANKSRHVLGWIVPRPFSSTMCYNKDR